MTSCDVIATLDSDVILESTLIGAASANCRSSVLSRFVKSEGSRPLISSSVYTNITTTSRPTRTSRAGARDMLKLVEIIYMGPADVNHLADSGFHGQNPRLGNRFMTLFSCCFVFYRAAWNADAV